MKIFIINTLYPPNIVGGAEQGKAKVAAGLVRAGHEVVVVTLHNSDETKIVHTDGVKIYYLPLDNIYWPYNSAAKQPSWKRLIWHLFDIWNFKAAARVANILDIEKPDVVSTGNIPGFSVSVWYEAFKRKIKIVHVLHDFSIVCPKTTMYNHGKVCTKRCGVCVGVSLPKYHASKWVSGVIGVSSFVCEQHRKQNFFPKAKFKAIYNIRDATQQSHEAQPAKKDPNVLTFGFIGRVEVEKGIEVLLAAAAQLPKSGWRLLVAGRGRDEYVDELKRKYGELPIEWIGYVKADDYYPRIDVAIVPSVLYETLGAVVSEAAVRNKPVILSDIGGMPEFLSMGVQGFLVPPSDAGKLANAMRDAILGKGVMVLPPTRHELMQAELNQDIVIRRYTDFFAEILSAR